MSLLGGGFDLDQRREDVEDLRRAVVRVVLQTLAEESADPVRVQLEGPGLDGLEKRIEALLSPLSTQLVEFEGEVEKLQGEVNSLSTQLSGRIDTVQKQLDTWARTTAAASMERQLKKLNSELAKLSAFLVSRGVPTVEAGDESVEDEVAPGSDKAEDLKDPVKGEKNRFRYGIPQSTWPTPDTLPWYNPRLWLHYWGRTALVIVILAMLGLTVYLLIGGVAERDSVPRLYVPSAPSAITDNGLVQPIDPEAEAAAAREDEKDRIGSAGKSKSGADAALAGETGDDGN